MSPKIEEIVKCLRGCKAGIAGGCRDCLMREKSGCINALHDAAADLIAELHQELIDERYRHDRLQDFCVAQGEELSELKKQSRWISVEERLPDGTCLAYVVASKGERVASIQVVMHQELWNCLPDGIRITHWMPLPEPPKEV